VSEGSTRRPSTSTPRQVRNWPQREPGAARARVRLHQQAVRALVELVELDHAARGLDHARLVLLGAAAPAGHVQRGAGGVRDLDRVDAGVGWEPEPVDPSANTTGS
jgi:hypothetical protein